MKTKDDLNRKLNIFRSHGCAGNCYKCLHKCSDAETIEVQTVDVDGSFDKEYEDYGIAIDIGTTTIAAALVGWSKERSEGDVIMASSGVNHQRRAGSDVISRISYAALDDGARELRKLVLGDILQLIKDMTNELTYNISFIVIAGNTTMLHLLREYNTEGLGSYPYEPQMLDMETISVEELYDGICEGVPHICAHSKVIIFPGISAFVGADIVAGIYGLNMAKETSKKVIMIDLGTNGEIAYFDGEKIITTSTAAGPVFEGGGISCGVPAVKGAVKHIIIQDFLCELDIIGDGKPIGLCGTGVIEAASEMLRTGIIDDTGLLTDEFFDDGFPVTKDGQIKIIQQDIRNIQLAKAAIYTGIKTVLGGEEPDLVYVSGGFGTHMDVDKIMSLKMFPESFYCRTYASGNSSLMGCIKLLVNYLAGKSNEAITEIKNITDIADNIQLADQEQFDSEYIEAMNF